MSLPSTPVRPSFNDLFGLSSSPGSEHACCPPTSKSGTQRPVRDELLKPLSSPAGSAASSPMAFKDVKLPRSRMPITKRDLSSAPKPRKKLTHRRGKSTLPIPAPVPSSGRLNRTQAPHAFSVSSATRTAEFSFVCTSCEPEPRYFASNGARKVHQRISHMPACIVHLPENQTYEVARVNGVFTCPLCARTNLSTDFLKQHTSRSANCSVDKLAALPSLPDAWTLLPGGVILGRKPSRKIKPVLTPIQTALVTPASVFPTPPEHGALRLTRSGRSIKPPPRFGGAQSQRSSTPLSSVSDLSTSPVETPIPGPIGRTTACAAMSSGSSPSDAPSARQSFLVAPTINDNRDKQPRLDPTRQSRQRKVAPLTGAASSSARTLNRPVKATVGTAAPVKVKSSIPNWVELDRLNPVEGKPGYLLDPSTSFESYQTTGFPPMPACAFLSNGSLTSAAASPAVAPTWPIYPPPRRARSPGLPSLRPLDPACGQPPSRNWSVPPPQTYQPYPNPDPVRRVSAPFAPATRITPVPYHAGPSSLSNDEFAHAIGDWLYTPVSALGAHQFDGCHNVAVPPSWLSSSGGFETRHQAAGQLWHYDSIAP